MLLDLHTHRPAPYPEGIISVGTDDFHPMVGQLYSIGLHPWYLAATPDGVEKQCAALREVASESCFAAIGEAGFDTIRGGAMMLQSLAFRCQVDLSEQLKKPLIIHCVKTQDMVIAWRRESGATMPWIVHGFRGKPAAAAQLLRAGCRLSFGPLFNPDTVRAVPAEMIFAETDESKVSITEVITALSEARDEDMFPIIEANLSNLFSSY